MDMTLDDRIRMSKDTRTARRNKSQKFPSGLAQYKSYKEVLAKRRSIFQGNHFPVAAETAQNAALTPLQSKVSNHSRMVNLSKARLGDPASLRRTASGGFAAKHPLPFLQQEEEEEVNVMHKQRPQTLDLLFANLKEQRMKVSSM